MSAPGIAVKIDERADGSRVAYVIIDNARKLNTLNSSVMKAFVAKFAELANDGDLRAAVLTGAGDRAFIGGADIDEMSSLDVKTARSFITRVHECCEALRTFPVPVIARVNGFTFGAGLEVAISCDIRIASATAIFGMPEVKLGIPSVVEAALLPKLVGWGRTREMLLLGENFSASNASAWGLVERVVPVDALDEAVEECVASILLAKPQAVRLQKQLIRAWEDLPLRAAVAAGIDAFAASWDTDEPSRAMAEFQATRKAKQRSKTQ